MVLYNNMKFVMNNNALLIINDNFEIQVSSSLIVTIHLLNLTKVKLHLNFKTVQVLARLLNYITIRLSAFLSGLVSLSGLAKEHFP